MAGAFVSVDLSGLPSPSIVEALDFETILSAMVADLSSRWPGFTALLESEPAVKLLEVAAYRELLVRRAFDDGARQTLLAFASGANLDHLAALFGVQRLVLEPADDNVFPPRPVVLESDADLRRRVQLAPEAFSVAGPAGAYIFHALGAHEDVLDASATRIAPGTVGVAVLSRSGAGVPTGAVLSAVSAALDDERVRPLNDDVVVSAAAVVPVDVTAHLTTGDGPGAAVAVETARARLAAYLEARHRLGLDVPLSGIFAALHVEGVERVALTAPSTDVVTSWNQAPVAGAVILTSGAGG